MAPDQQFTPEVWAKGMKAATFKVNAVVKVFKCACRGLQAAQRACTCNGAEAYIDCLQQTREPAAGTRSVHLAARRSSPPPPTHTAHPPTPPRPEGC